MSAALEAARAALAGTEAWLVGGAVRDGLLGRSTEDHDVVAAGDVEAHARTIARALDAAAFPLSEAFGAWRVTRAGAYWRVDLTPLRGSIEADLARRDFTVNAMARPLAGGDRLDPHGGGDDLAARRLRMVSRAALADDPLRTLRAARLACELELEIEPETAAAVRDQAAGVAGVAPERVFAELRRIVAAPGVVAGVKLLASLSLTPVVLPELAALRGVGQSDYHHLDVYDHTVAVLGEVVALQHDPAAAFPDRAGEVTALLAEPLADELTRGEALRFGALLHDVAKPRTRSHTEGGRVTFLGHDEVGADLARSMLERLRASERLRAHVAALTRHHLRLGFLVHRRPLAARELYRYLRACDPVEADVTLLSVADRLATRGRRADDAIAAHVELAREVLAAALRWRAQGPPAPLVRGDELARELGVPPGPEVGRLLESVAEAQYAGEVADRAGALAHARDRLPARAHGGEARRPLR